MCIVVVVGNWRGITALLAAVAWLGKKKTFPFSAPLCFQMQREHPRRRLRRHVHVGQGHGGAQELYRLLSKFESASSQEVFRHQLTNTKSTVSSPIKKQKRFRFVLVGYVASTLDLACYRTHFWSWHKQKTAHPAQKIIPQIVWEVHTCGFRDIHVNFLWN